MIENASIRMDATGKKKKIVISIAFQNFREIAVMRGQL